MAQAVHAWGAQRLYTHVEADNEVRAACKYCCARLQRIMGHFAKCRHTNV
jgi:hypothetical protein